MTSVCVCVCSEVKKGNTAGSCGVRERKHGGGRGKAPYMLGWMEWKASLVLCYRHIVAGGWGIAGVSGFTSRDG